jgi:hypothetical protein
MPGVIASFDARLNEFQSYSPTVYQGGLSNYRVLAQLGILRSEGPAVNSPVREGGVGATVIYLSAEGAEHRYEQNQVPALRASRLSRGYDPRPHETL